MRIALTILAAAFALAARASTLTWISGSTTKVEQMIGDCDWRSTRRTSGCTSCLRIALRTPNPCDTTIEMRRRQERTASMSARRTVAEHQAGSTPAIPTPNTRDRSQTARGSAGHRRRLGWPKVPGPARRLLASRRQAARAPAPSRRPRRSQPQLRSAVLVSSSSNGPRFSGAARAISYRARENCGGPRPLLALSWAAFDSCHDLKDRSRFVVNQGLDGCALFAQNSFDSRSRYVSDAQPDDFGRRSPHDCKVDQVAVFRDDDEVVLLRVVPNVGIGRFLEVKESNVRRLRKVLREASGDFVRNVLDREAASPA